MGTKRTEYSWPAKNHVKLESVKSEARTIAPISMYRLLELNAPARAVMTKAPYNAIVPVPVGKAKAHKTTIDRIKARIGIPAFDCRVTK